MMGFEPDDFDDEESTAPFDREARARVLVVDDDEDLRELIAARLRREGLDIVEAGSGDEALDVLMTALHSHASETIDLVVMDVRMPGPSGLEVARMLRAVESPVPIVLISGFPDGAVVREVSRLGVVLLAKPFALERLTEAAIAALLDRRQIGGHHDLG